VTRHVAGRRVTPAEVADRLSGEKHVLAVTHESPDGDALGCLTAFVLMCERLAVPYVAFVPGEAPFPTEYQFLPRLHDVARGDIPALGPQTTVYMLDCASLARGGCHLSGEGVTLVTIDHHQDNPGNADLNLIDAAAASTTAILYDIFKAGRFPIDVQIAASLYVGLVTDSGRFQFSNTNARAHRMAADLQDMGVDVSAISRQVYESVPLPKLRLLGRALEHVEVKHGGVLVTSWLREDDFAAVGADGSHAEGIIDTLRTIRGATVAVLARQRSGSAGLETKVSLRCTDGQVDVAAIAALKGGGGHTQAAGFTAAGDVKEVLEWTERQLQSVL
jgi:bifunctional oligoribonuclease and PAP phosphatase NrnA